MSLSSFLASAPLIPDAGYERRVTRFTPVFQTDADRAIQREHTPGDFVLNGTSRCATWNASFRRHVEVQAEKQHRAPEVMS